ncbi:hypothetical protein CSIM01_12612 [Colletotrichum simmondsii]|uniref:Uncharacterized protein n=1 Tax=Colletotrichum simmondsii TaxID=703756 RepID=A0A135RUA7_9PEZI|nr:hypothetical protein CSIM01_12612 [Colletotrichum simmondsii]
MDEQLPMTSSISRDTVEYVERLIQQYNGHLEHQLNREMKVLVDRYEDFRRKVRKKLVSETPNRFPPHEKESIIAQIENHFLCNVRNLYLDQVRGFIFSSMDYGPSKQSMFVIPPELDQSNDTPIVLSDELPPEQAEKTTDYHLDPRSPSFSVLSHRRSDLNTRRRRGHNLESPKDTQVQRSCPAPSTKKPLRKKLSQNGVKKLKLKKQNTKPVQRAKQKTNTRVLTSSITRYYPDNFVFSYKLNDDTNFYILSYPNMDKGCRRPIFSSDPFENGPAAAHFQSCGLPITNDDDIVREYARPVTAPKNDPPKQRWVKQHNDGLKARESPSPRNSPQTSTCHDIPASGKETKDKPDGTGSNKDLSFEPESDDHRDELASTGSDYDMD